MSTDRLDIDYQIIDKLNNITKDIDTCICKGDWERKKELEKIYFEIYDQLDIIHQEYIEQRKGRY